MFPGRRPAGSQRRDQTFRRGENKQHASAELSEQSCTDARPQCWATSGGCLSLPELTSSAPGGEAHPGWQGREGWTQRARSARPSESGSALNWCCRYVPSSPPYIPSSPLQHPGLSPASLLLSRTGLAR